MYSPCPVLSSHFWPPLQTYLRFVSRVLAARNSSPRARKITPHPCEGGSALPIFFLLCGSVFAQVARVTSTRTSEATAGTSSADVDDVSLAVVVDGDASVMSETERSVEKKSGGRAPGSSTRINFLDQRGKRRARERALEDESGWATGAIATLRARHRSL